MTDFTLNAPGTTSNPYSPAGILIFGTNTLKSDATGFRDSAFSYTPFVHNVTYGTTIVSTVTLATASSGDDIFLGAIVRSGANAGALIGVWITNVSLIFGTSTPTGTFTSASTSTTITRALGDVFACTIGLSGGVATCSAFTQNGTTRTFSNNTTTTFATEASLAAGAAFLPNNSNGTYLSQFTGTGVSAGTGIVLLSSPHMRRRRLY